MTRVPLFLSCLCLVPWLVPSAAQAQPSSGTVFVGAAGFADVRRASTSSALNGREEGTSGTEPGGAIALGVHLTPRLSVRAEWSLTGTMSSTRAMPVYPLALVPELTTTLLPPTLLPSTQLLLPQETVERRDVKAGFALVGYHLAAGRASIELLGGVALVNERVTTVIDRFSPFGLPPSGFRSEYVNSAHHAAPAVGADAAVSLAAHAALVPQVRLFVLNGALHVRPGLGLRWTF